MKTLILSLILFTIPTLSFGRLMRAWTYQQLMDEADLVAVARPITSKDTTERGRMPEAGNVKTVGLETEFEIRVVMNGDKGLKKLRLHHYRLEDPKAAPPNGPHFVSFKTPSDPRDCFLLFLKKEPDGRYAPVSGQMDPAFFSILKLDGFAE